MIRLRQSGVDEVLIKRVRDWYDPGPGCFFSGVTGVASFNPASLFTGPTTGAWYDPSDFTTLFQDAAGTTPVTAVEQPVGRMLDKSGRGNHAFNSSGNSANFPVLSARYNLLTYSEQFDNAAWVKDAADVAQNAGSAPDGTATADKVIATAAVSGYHRVRQDLAALPAAQYTFSVYAKAAEYSLLRIADSAGGSFRASIDLTSDAVSNTGGPTFVSANSIAVGNGWHRITLVMNAAGGTIYRFSMVGYPAGAAITNFGAQYTGDGTSGIYIWGADLRVANDALNQPAYQRVNTSSDYDTVGFKRGEVFDGINDYLTASAGGGSTTSFFWCSAIRAGKVGAVQTLFSDAGTNTGYRVRINASNQLELSAGNGTAYTTVSTTATLSIGQRAVLTAWHDGTNLNVQINNGTVHQVAFSTATAGTAQFTIGKDNNAASNFFAGWLYEKVYTKDNVPSVAQIADTKAYVANIAGITL